MKNKAVLGMLLAGLMLTGQSCFIKGINAPEQEPLTGSREELEKTIGDVVPDAIAVQLELAFRHTKPGSYSDLTALFTSSPFTDIEAAWSGPCLSDTSKTKGQTDANGRLEVEKRITCFGDYRAQGTASKGGQTATFDQTVKVK